MADIKNVLREEGNELFNKRKYREALQKYTEAINAYPNDYFSWSNRAITRIKLEDYDEALADGKKSTEIEPNFARGYHRVAIALERLKRYDECLDALNKSLQLDPNVSGAKEDRKRVEKLIGKQRKQQRNSNQVSNLDPSMSTRLSIACRDFEEGLNQTRNSFSAPILMFVQDGLAYTFALRSGIEKITDGIMNDDRCFHFESDESELIKKAILMEYVTKRPLDPDTMSIEETIRQYSIKNQREGWDTVRMELTANIRVYFLLGYLNVKFSEGAVDQLEGGVGNIQKSVDLITAARSIDPREERDEIFKPMFIRCFQIHLIKALMKLYEHKHDLQILNRIENEATSIISSCETHPISRGSEQYMCYSAPHLSEAYDGLGFIAIKRFNNKLKEEPDFEILKLAINNYEKGSQYLPNDDPDKAKMIYNFTFCKLKLGNFSCAEINNHVTNAEKIEKAAIEILENLKDINECQPKIDVIKFLENIKRSGINVKDEFILPPLYDVDFKDDKFGQILTQRVKHISLSEEMSKIRI
ncbi:uncharacterized protein OCT59_014345 [Rhizophagus irregularis]|uniref:Uncharacterized protein n=4 Tax=Rhizophagus irregularis TaxID=588596 RepID=A0A915ZE44_9GLOM|nr:hypothetical protein GLOIN_2v1843133 [Rhizophagus irregularis DAOM 181602=DAOM 197198]EXX56398.1 Sti1p [Rhizophagus irregularis DAOM 197198w]UZO21965.1 hypothetical protein OCT59_014345 [Rhizophagus irregularis]POG68168.1 hypothetical protein GLOIN_2v1843133 [Rhizophagus irregularis DAOM 181602=DAOM 197198]CAB4480821.1 unnamed protein product [Rhizophagus irregularis]CAB5179309.1 unnamed protein product [Rhizophagus irregularis]|eukprot:XP_025175034.1 hypothetical protein GLOIN_2v1843133 [Rhizophagus irregularis DAOM 181602=DAOM 197198]